MYSAPANPDRRASLSPATRHDGKRPIPAATIGNQAAPALRPPLRPAGRWVRWWWIAAATVVIGAGFGGLDRWFYQHVSLALETKDRPVDRDFYTVTKPFWLFWRYSFGHILVGPLACAAVALLRPQDRRRAGLALLAVALAAGLANGTQALVGRLRPDRAESHLAFAPAFSLLWNKQKVSFPSGEATTAFALACVLTDLLPRWRIPLYAAGVLTAAARLINGAHYLSDVVAGALLGTLVASLVLGLAGRRPGGGLPDRQPPTSSSVGRAQGSIDLAGREG